MDKPTFATVADVHDHTGLMVTAEKIQAADERIRARCGGVDLERLTTRDRFWLKLATVYMAAGAESSSVSSLARTSWQKQARRKS